MTENSKRYQAEARLKAYLETSATKNAWWDSLNAEQQKLYLKSHPKSKLKIRRGNTERALPKKVDVSVIDHLNKLGYKKGLSNIVGSDTKILYDVPKGAMKKTIQFLESNGYRKAHSGEKLDDGSLNPLGYEWRKKEPVTYVDDENTINPLRSGKKQEQSIWFAKGRKRPNSPEGMYLFKYVSRQ